MRTIPFTHTNLDVSHPPSAPLYAMFSLNWVRGGGCDGFGGELRGSRAASALDAEREWRRGLSLGAAHHHLSIRDLAGVPAGDVAVERHLSAVELAGRTRAAGVRRRERGWRRERVWSRRREPCWAHHFVDFGGLRHVPRVEVELEVPGVLELAARRRAPREGVRTTRGGGGGGAAAAAAAQPAAGRSPCACSRLFLRTMSA